MVFRKHKKVKKYRGSKTHGCGSMKKRRGAGNRGGRGKAGSGKRGDCKKPAIWNNKKYFGKHGFTHSKKNIKIVNIEFINEKINKLAEKKGDVYHIDLGKHGYNKLLGKGKVINKFEIKVDSCSVKAKQKIEAAGGKVNVPLEQNINESS